MIASGLLVSPILLNMRKVGTASAVVGTITEPSTNQNRGSRPRNWNLAKP